MQLDFVWVYAGNFILSLAGTLVLVLLAKHLGFLNDHHQGAQKVHLGVIPRVGGLALVSSFFIGIYSSQSLIPVEDWISIKLLLACSLPAFLGGVFEDFTKQISPLARFILTIASAISAYFALGATIELEFFDFLFQYKLVALLVTGLAVAGVANGANMIDGFNGLLVGYTMLAAGFYAAISWQLGDLLFFHLHMALIFSCLGFLVFNWPKAFIFLGDGGSYFLGFILAESAILLYVRNSAQISPVALGVALSFPVVETLFSMLRRGLRMFQADDLHLHQLLFRYLKQKNYASPNPYVMLLVLPLTLIPMVVSYFFYTNSLLAFAGFFVFLALYLILYTGLKGALLGKKQTDGLLF